MYYMLNLVFNTTTPVPPIGRFMDYDSTQTNLLLTSKVWLQPAPGVTTPDPNRSGDWVFFERDKQHLDFDLKAAPTLWVRVVDANPNDNFYARITILMGRNDQKHAPQPMSSPILNASVVVGPLCIWDTLTPGGSAFVQASTTTGGGTVASWFTNLGLANQGLGASGTRNNYIFLVAATVRATQAMTFSHDPDMDITC